MELALREAERAAEEEEVPVGCVVVCREEGDRLVGRAHNQTERLRDPTAHAEMIALTQAAGALGRARLTGCELFVTLEPCFMCAGACILARVDRVVFGARDPKFGACGSLWDLPGDGRVNHRFPVQGGVLAEPAAALLRAFFQGRR
jgi:tRNA(adenine34) deaminase